MRACPLQYSQRCAQPGMLPEKSHIVEYLPTSGVASQNGQACKEKHKAAWRSDIRIPAMGHAPIATRELGNLASWGCSLARDRPRRHDDADGACLPCGAPWASTRQGPGVQGGLLAQASHLAAQAGAPSSPEQSAQAPCRAVVGAGAGAGRWCAGGSRGAEAPRRRSGGATLPTLPLPTFAVLGTKLGVSAGVVGAAHHIATVACTGHTDLRRPPTR